MGNRRAAERVVDRIGELLPCAVEIERYERYWKFPEPAELRFVSPLRRSTPEDALLTTLRWAWKIATPWSLSGPEPGVRHGFEGTASSHAGAGFSVVGVEWRDFTLTDRREKPFADTVIDIHG